ncbi:MAG: DUF2237 domain-containing protein [Bacteroidetes bacterium HGW-Bacteroidetes-1]|jgi:hypothetical protein|nr:MAG: DUF2237 domain-containing protein [Bacteroidetes bacterium HGW-Bacteroidetes-1]
MGKNVFGEPMISCSTLPMTGFYRDGCCETGEDDRGRHTVCAVMNEEFLQFSSMAGNDLVTPVPVYGFPGLKPGDKWCLCALRWVEAWKANKAPLVVLEATHEKTLDYIPLTELVKFAWKFNVEGTAIK